MTEQAKPQHFVLEVQDVTIKLQGDFTDGKVIKRRNARRNARQNRTGNNNVRVQRGTDHVHGTNGDVQAG
jgi:hypothetical protein